MVAQMIFCPQLRDIEYIIENNTIKRKPSQIYVQCGTNDIERSIYNMEEMSTRINNLTSALIDRVLDEDGEIIISSLLPRTDNMDKVKRMNDFLVKITRYNRIVKFMRNNNITERMLSPNDRKHLGNTRFRILLANIRFILFGEMPRNIGISHFKGEIKTSWRGRLVV